MPGKRQRRWWGLVLLGLAGLLGSSASSSGPDARGGGERDEHAAPYELGRDLFLHETFGGNGRTCATCHDPAGELTISPERVRQRYAADPDDPLFRPIDSNDGEGRDYSNLLNRALVRVTVPLHRRVWLADDPMRRSISVWRGVPGLANVALTAPYDQDGRAATLEDQAIGAIESHFEPTRAPRPRELSALARFEEELYYPLRLRALAPSGDGPVPETGFSIPLPSPEAVHGRAVFERHCGQCHAGDLEHRSADPAAPVFENVSVSERNLPGLPLLRLAFVLDDGTVRIVETPDPGRAAITGRIEDLNRFEIPQLRGLKHTAPYFHDNSAATIADMIDHYVIVLRLQINRQDKADLATFLELL